MSKSILLFAVTSLLGAAAHAEDPPASPFTANVSLTSNYKFRGQDQGKNKPAIQGGFDYTKDGFYIGNWNSSIGWLGGNSSIEMDFYGGYKGEITKDLGYDVGILQYAYPGSGFANTTEIYGGLSYSFFSAKYSHTVSKDYFGTGASAESALGFRPSGRNTGYLDLSGNFPVATGLTLNTHVGYTRYAADLRNNVGVPNYWDYKVGVTYDLGSGVSVAGAVVGANQQNFYEAFNGSPVNKTRFIATISKAM